MGTEGEVERLAMFVQVHARCIQGHFAALCFSVFLQRWAGVLGVLEWDSALRQRQRSALR